MTRRHYIEGSEAGTRHTLSPAHGAIRIIRRRRPALLHLVVCSLLVLGGFAAALLIIFNGPSS